MKIEEKHKALLKELGLVEEDFEKFDGKFVTYEYDEQKGVRIYDPYYTTSYNEYIGVDGWSAWSSEKDTFMTDILRGAKEKAKLAEQKSERPEQDEIAEALKKKFGHKPEED
ncbi:MAG: hypothetical protein DRH12_03975 [Deltaproteobacteria bacterium]|nr:MAG: hypothetical protein DRH12_03975 [Deltaproteobacteria bacterium]